MSTRAYQPVMQALPAKSPEALRITRAFTKVPSARLVDADYSDLELRILHRYPPRPSK